MTRDHYSNNKIPIRIIWNKQAIPYAWKFFDKNIPGVKFLLHLIFVIQATWLFFVALITHHRQIFVCLIFVDQATHENLSPMKISSSTKEAETCKQGRILLNCKKKVFKNVFEYSSSLDIWHSHSLLQLYYLCFFFSFLVLPLRLSHSDTVRNICLHHSSPYCWSFLLPFNKNLETFYYTCLRKRFSR